MQDAKVIVIGSGAAGYAAALCLVQNGVKDVTLLTDRRENGTSRNAGSDKQTYYKLSLCGDAPDSVADMAATLYNGGSVDGDVAYAEAAGSVRGFLRLAALGVPFPTNEYGEFVGYKTDNDPKRRGTSAGPLTSRFMTECLERAVFEKEIKLIDGVTAVRLAIGENAVQGVVGVTREGQVVSYPATDVILATGGPAAIYENTVYPIGQTGMTGLALEAGAALQNFAEWQYGIASTKFRWNLSGSYQQVLPRYLSSDESGREYDFLADAFASPEEEWLAIFLKGYQWPFAAAHLDGSSRIDRRVYEELRRGRRVYLDYRENPAGWDGCVRKLPEEARQYLENCGATQKTPIERLAAMNPRAIELYAAHGIDLYGERLEITLAAQHCNGGVAVDAHWQTSVKGLYAVGEAAGTFGVARPGGSALNSTQVGAFRAAEAIAFGKESRRADPGALESARIETEEMKNRLLAAGRGGHMACRRAVQRAMSGAAAAMRMTEAFDKTQAALENALSSLTENGICDPYELAGALVTRDAILAAGALLSAERLAADTSGSRGSAVYYRGGQAVPEDAAYREMVMMTELQDGRFVSRYRPRRPLPAPDLWFERVWKKYQERL